MRQSGFQSSLAVGAALALGLLGTTAALAQSKQAISSALVNIYRALGGGWEDKSE